MTNTLTTVIIIVLYFVPVIVAYAMKVPRKLNVWLVNILLGWTVIGWFVALGLCFYLNREKASAAPSAPTAPTGMPARQPVIPSAPSSPPPSAPWEQGPISSTPTPPPAAPGVMPWDTPGTS